jgi:hypothetical protein
MNSQKICIKEPSEDEKLRQAYHRICQRARLYAGEPISGSESESGTESENEKTHSFFNVESYVYLFHDKITQILANTDNCIYMKIHGTKIPKISVNQIRFEFGSNCCLMVSINFNYTFAKFVNKRKLCENDITICSLNKQTHHVTKLLTIKPCDEDDEDDEESIKMCQLVMHDKFEQHNAVAFTIVSDLDLKDMSLWFKVGYMDYTYLDK